MKVVNLWNVDLDAAEPAGSWQSWVDPEEHRQSRSFANPRDIQRFLVRRAARRFLVASELGQPFHEVRFERGIHGKPLLVGTAPEVHFNASHSAGRALIAVGRSGPVGVDLERQVNLGDDLDRVRSALAPSEQTALSTVPPEERALAFFAVWTRKEAVLKAAGIGLRRPLNSFAVPVSINAPPQWVWLGADSAPWWVQTLEAEPGFSAALATPAEVRLVWNRFAFP